MTRERNPCVYMMANRMRGTLYVGVTADLAKRAWEHRSGAVEGFTKRYGLHRLVWFEQHEEMEQAILQEKRLKRWRREWKIALVEHTNPSWRDLYDEIAE
jgi:putative endonuclease